MPKYPCARICKCPGIISPVEGTLTTSASRSMFSLAVNVCRHFGIEPVERVELKDEDVGHYIEEPMHSRLTLHAINATTRATTGGK